VVHAKIQAMEKILLTGASGFIAHKTALMLLDQGHEVIGVDNMNDYYDVALKEYRKNQLLKYPSFTFYNLDIENLEALSSIFKKHSFTKVLNLAARAGVRYSMENPHVYMSTNAQGTLNLLELMKEYGIKKFVLASTSSLYAGQAMPFLESLPVNTPISPYAATKKAAEVMAYTYHHLYKIDVSVVRYFTVYGEGSRPDMAQFRFMRWIDEGHAIELFGDGSQARDFTHVDDIARGTILAMQDVGYEILNLGGGNNPIPMTRMIELLEAELGKNAHYNHKPFHEADMKQTWADINKAQNLLGWKPTISFEEGISRCVKDYENHHTFYRSLKL
jgi:UDP-glucuronate 4-epimerase